MSVNPDTAGNENGDGSITPVKVLVLTGMSGAGKTKAVNSLEDLGYFCIDNLPPYLFLKFMEGVSMMKNRIRQVVLVVDVRSIDLFPKAEEALQSIREMGDCQIVFLEASDEVLIRRFKETRRKHPLTEVCASISQSISKEREMLQNIRGLADYIIDTSNLTTNQLNQEIVELFSYGDQESMKLSIMSFGYKYGLPIEADLVMDVRFLPNPYYIPELKLQTGLNKDVSDFVFDHEVSREFINRYVSMLRFLLPHYKQEGKRHLTIAIGCTGGRHRSVAIAETIYQHLNAFGYHPYIYHRDIKKDGLPNNEDQGENLQTKRTKNL